MFKWFFKFIGLYLATFMLLASTLTLILSGFIFFGIYSGEVVSSERLILGVGFGTVGVLLIVAAKLLFSIIDE